MDPTTDALLEAAKLAAEALPAADRARLLAALAVAGRLRLDRTAAGWIRIAVDGYGLLVEINPATLRPSRAVH